MRLLTSWPGMRLVVSVGVVGVLSAIAQPLRGQIPNGVADQLPGRNFGQPGARAAALGGAFTGLADDATAVESNPAGLTTLLYPEFAFEVKRLRDLGQDFQEAKRQSAFPSFMSFVLPVGRMRLALFRSVLAHVQYGYGESWAYTADTTWNQYAYAQRTITDYGVGWATKIGATVSLGVTFGLATVTASDSLVQWGATSAGVFNMFRSWTDIGTNPRPFGSVGALVNLGPRVRLGATYWLRPTFQAVDHFQTIDARSQPDNFVDTTTLALPKSFDVGISARATEGLTLTGAISARQSYWQPDTTGSSGAAYTNRAHYRVEEHAGAELVKVVRGMPVALRAGAQRVMKQVDETSYETQLSFGAGFVFKRRLQIDGALVTGTENPSEFVVSTVYRLGAR